MRFLFTPNGTYGDIHPYLGIAERLKLRGHEVIFFSNPHFSDLIENCGFGFVALRTEEELKEYWDHPDMWSRHNYWKLSLDYCALRPMRDMYHAIAKYYLPGETVVAGPAWSFGARLAQEKLGVPYATIHLEPYWIRSYHRTSVMPLPMHTRDWVPRISKRFQFWIADTFFTDRYLSKPTNTFREELGLPPTKHFMKTWWHSPQRAIGLFPEWFFSTQPDWPSQVRLTQFPLWDRSNISDLPYEVATFLDAGDPPVIFTPGSGNCQAKHFFSVAAEVCQSTGRRGIFLTKYPQQVAKELPESIKHFSYVPLSFLLNKSCAMVHHAGTGTAALCMKAGLPQIVMPMAYDQPDFADCLSRLGVATILPPRKLNARTLARALDSLLNSPELDRCCRKVAKKMNEAAPFDSTCNLLIELGGSDGQAAASKLDHPICYV